MSTITNPKSKPRGRVLPADDPFRYGWRYVQQQKPDGTITCTEIPLTLEDVLHPQMGDVILESSLHNLIRGYLKDVARLRTLNDPTALVLSDCGIYWDDPNLPFDHHSPDVSLLFGVRRQKINWNSFNVAEEGVRPSLLMEVVSPSTRKNDVETKLDHYHRVRVPTYIIIDREEEDGPWTLRGYTYTRAKYVPMKTDETGRLWLEPLGVWLGINDGKAVCYDGKTGEIIGDYLQVNQKLAEEAKRAEQEKQRADTEKSKAELEKHRADAEKSRAELEKHRADAEKSKAELEKHRADAEKSRAEQAEARLRQLEAELLRQKNQGDAS